MRSIKSRLLGLLTAAVLGMLALAASAQAVTELGTGFFINGAQVLNGLNAIFTGKQLGRGTVTIPSVNLEINCEKFTIFSTIINTATDGEFKFLYEECTILTNQGGKLEDIYGCQIVINHEEGVQKNHITAAALFLPAELKEGTPAILVENIAAKVLFRQEIGCLLPKTTEFRGEVCLKVNNNHVAEPELEAGPEIQGLCKARLTLNGAEVNGTMAEIKNLEGEGKAFLDKLFLFGAEAFLNAKMKVHLSGMHEGLTLGVLLI